jgi:hypothetical protein
MIKTPEKTYIVTEEEILRISEIMGCMEDAVKEIIRSSRNGTNVHGYRQTLFFEASANAKLNQEDQENYLY